MDRSSTRPYVPAAALWLALSLAPVAAQRPPASQAGTPQVPAVQLSASVSVVLVDAVVLDERGHFAEIERSEMLLRARRAQRAPQCARGSRTNP